MTEVVTQDGSNAPIVEWQENTAAKPVKERLGL